MPNLEKGKRPKDYYAYLLRIWQDYNGEDIAPIQKKIWRASLQRPNEKKRLTFASLDELFHYLENQVLPESTSLSQREQQK